LFVFEDSLPIFMIVDKLANKPGLILPVPAVYHVGLGHVLF